MALLQIILWTAAVTIIGGGSGYLLWLKSRPKKITWKAKIYQLSEGVKPPTKDKKGNIVSNISISELKPYATDILERVEKKPGITVYRLIHLNKTTPAVTADNIIRWGDTQEVHVLYDGESCTLLKQGYDNLTGSIIFHPLPYDDVTMIKNEMAIRKDRLQEKKDILTAITPWVVAGIMAITLMGMAYLMVEGFVKISENLEDSVKYQADQQVKAAEITRAGMSELAGQVYNVQEDNNLGKQNINKESPPSIE